LIESVEIAHEEDFKASDEYKYKLAAARATEYTRKIANIRGTEADPDFMEY